jgi:hypothetical protein
MKANNKLDKGHVEFKVAATEKEPIKFIVKAKKITVNWGNKIEERVSDGVNHEVFSHGFPIKDVHSVDEKTRRINFCNSIPKTSFHIVHIQTEGMNMFCIGGLFIPRPLIRFGECPELTEVACYAQGDTHYVDISNLNALEEFTCVENALKHLDVSKNLVLRKLDCWENNLSELDVSNNIALEYLDCWNNRIKTLDVGKNKSLYYLKCGHNPLLESIDVSNAPLLYLDCRYTKITKLDVSTNKKLETLECCGCALTELDVSNNTNLEMIDCSNNNLDTEALNTLFESLPIREEEAVIYIDKNPGTDTCNVSIAEKKMWKIDRETHEPAIYVDVMSQE